MSGGNGLTSGTGISSGKGIGIGTAPGNCAGMRRASVWLSATIGRLPEISPLPVSPPTLSGWSELTPDVSSAVGGPTRMLCAIPALLQEAGGRQPTYQLYDGAGR